MSLLQRIDTAAHALAGADKGVADLRQALSELQVKLNEAERVKWDLEKELGALIRQLVDSKG